MEVCRILSTFTVKPLNSVQNILQEYINSTSQHHWTYPWVAKRYKRVSKTYFKLPPVGIKSQLWPTKIVGSLISRAPEFEAPGQRGPDQRQMLAALAKAER